MQKINQCFSTLGCHDWSLNEIVLLAKTYSMDALEIRGINSVMDNAAIEDFSDENIEKAGNIQRFYNGHLDKCISEITSYIKTQLK